MPGSPKQPSSFEFPHPHFALLYVDHHGKVQMEASPSIAGCGGAIFTPDVTGRFVEMTTPMDQSKPQFSTEPITPVTQSPWGVPPVPAGWQQSGPPPTELIPCEWQSAQHRRKRRDVKRSGIAKPRLKSQSPPPTPPGRTILRIGHRDLMRRYYEKAFEDFQQLNCRAIAKSYIKLVEPRKQVHFPYNGRRVISGATQRVDPELTKPGWWPAGVPHREPDHLLKRDRLRLLVHILCELKDRYGITAEKLREAGQDVRRQITPANRLEVLDEIYFVRRMEEQYLDGEIEGDTLVQVAQTHLPEAAHQDIQDLPSRAVVAKVEEDAHGYHHRQSSVVEGGSSPLQRKTGQRVLPLSPATSPSSPHSPPAGSYGAYPVTMPQQSPRCMPHANPGYMTGYYGPFVGIEKDPAPELWQPPGHAAHYGY
ncbi:hypothetical protein N7510_000548 [Penicillium lagena]|uniref:uncharacterized protein n=1 Tax=Penicillium lagena TaxID=94218 RepID=UPI00253F8E47|nr:uncharacterized protein N7510_000548 [Penicillium lagena]KAJ5624239.1 hypothetical protein N7510_000548 [Penicillium lagena]